MKNSLPVSIEQPKILFFSTFVSFESGASHALLLTIRRVAARGVNPVVIIPDTPDSYAMFPKDEFDVVYLKMQRPRRTWNVWIHARCLLSCVSVFFFLCKSIRKRGIDLLHFNEITDCVAGMAAKFSGVPCVCHVRTDRPPTPYRCFLLTILRRTVHVIAVPSKSTAEWIISDAIDLEQRIRLIYDFSFDISKYEQPVSGLGFRRELDIPVDAILVVLVSKLVIQKGHLCFIRAAEKILRISKDIRFVIIGGTVPGHEKEATEIRTLAEKLTPAPGLCIIGPREDLPVVYAASDIAVHCPTYPDPYPTVVLLPMLAGKCVIGSNMGGIPEQIEQDRTGILVPADDPDALAAAVLHLVGDPAKRDSLGVAAQSWLREQCAAEMQGRALLDLYSEIIQGVPQGREKRFQSPKNRRNSFEHETT